MTTTGRSEPAWWRLILTRLVETEGFSGIGSRRTVTGILGNLENLRPIVRGRLDSTGREEGSVARRGCQGASLNTWRKLLYGNYSYAMAA